MASIRDQINIAAPIRAVWRALTTAEGLEAWLADQARVEARKGGRLVLGTEDEEGKMVEERGMFHELRPTRIIEIAWDTTSPGPDRGTRLQFQVARDGDETRVLLQHSGSGVLDEEEGRAATERRWRLALKTLRRSLEGEAV